MKPFVRYALLLSAVMVAGGGIAAAQFDKSSSLPGGRPAYDNGSQQHRGAAKFFGYDLNHDGKVTRDEMNKALGQEFAQIAGSAPAFWEAQFVTFRLKGLREHTDQMFHRADWNGDGRLSFEEYMTPERVRFEYADHDGKGVIACGFRPSDTAYGQDRRNKRRSSARGSGAFCKSMDLNHDGQVSRAEFDKSVQQEFSAVAKGGFLTADGYYAIVSAHVRDSATRMFARLDRNHDGKVDRAEYAASQARYFDKLDRNHDGAVTRDEYYANRRTASDNSRKPGRG